MKITVKFASSVAALGLFTVFSPVAALAQDAASGSTSEATSEDEIVVSGELDEGERERCRVIRVTGTRFSERVCMSQNDYDAQRTNNRDVMNDHRYDGPGLVEIEGEGLESGNPEGLSGGGWPNVPPI